MAKKINIYEGIKKIVKKLKSTQKDSSSPLCASRLIEGGNERVGVGEEEGGR